MGRQPPGFVFVNGGKLPWRARAVVLQDLNERKKQQCVFSSHRQTQNCLFNCSDCYVGWIMLGNKPVRRDDGWATVCAPATRQLRCSSHPVCLVWVCVSLFLKGFTLARPSGAGDTTSWVLVNIVVTKYYTKDWTGHSLFLLPPIKVSLLISGTDIQRVLGGGIIHVLCCCREKRNTKHYHQNIDCISIKNVTKRHFQKIYQLIVIFSCWITSSSKNKCNFLILCEPWSGLIGFSQLQSSPKTLRHTKVLL